MGRLVTLDEMLEIRRTLARDNRVLAWTNGCFDLLHAGHVRYLAAARALADVLVVGLNSDDSVRALKGPARPLNPLADRAEVLAALAAVDYVLPFDGVRCHRELSVLTPDFFVKAGDYAPDTLDPDERAAVERAGGCLRFMPFLFGRGTTALAAKAARAAAANVNSPLKKPALTPGTALASVERVKNGLNKAVFNPVSPSPPCSRRQFSLFQRAVEQASSALARRGPVRIISGAFGLIRDESGRLLLVGSREADGRIRWGLPGGGQESGERLEETLRREILEETGLIVRRAAHRGVIERIDPARPIHLVLHLYEVEVVPDPAAAPRDPEIIDAAWVDDAGLAAFPGVVQGRRTLIDYLREPAAWPSYVFMGPGEE